MDYKKLSIQYFYETNEFTNIPEDRLTLYDSYQDIPEEDRSINESDHPFYGEHRLGLLDAKKIKKAYEDNTYMHTVLRIRYLIPFIAACRAVVALSPDAALTKEYAYWLENCEEELRGAIKSRKEQFDKLTKDITSGDWKRRNDS